MTDTDNSDVISLGQSRSDLPGKDLGQIRRYWDSMRKEGNLPRRADIDPRGIKSLLTNAMIAEKVAPGLARLRIAGQHLSDLMGMEVRGMPISAFIAPDHRDQLAQALTELFERPAILTAQLNAPGSLRNPKMSGTLMLLPLRSDLGDVSRALGCMVTTGAMGRVPRRFEIASLKIEPVDLKNTAAHDPIRQGFAETARPFEMDHPSLSSERSYLRLVKLD